MMESEDTSAAKNTEIPGAVLQVLQQIDAELMVLYRLSAQSSGQGFGQEELQARLHRQLMRWRNLGH